MQKPESILHFNNYPPRRNEGRKVIHMREEDMRILSIINLKGGVAKTITSVVFAYILAAVFGYRVLLVDNDKQGDASRQLRRRSTDRKGIEEIMLSRRPDMKKLIQKTDYDNLDIITANMKLLKANLEVMLDQQRPQQTRLEKALESVAGEYDFCIIDNAPDINISTINALVASDDVIVPLEIDDNTTEGLPELIEQIENTREDLNERLTLRGCLVTKFDGQNEAHVQGEGLLRSGNYPVFETHIRVSKKVSESTFNREPVFLYSRRAAASMDYLKAVGEYLETLGIA